MDPVPRGMCCESLAMSARFEVEAFGPQLRGFWMFPVSSGMIQFYSIQVQFSGASDIFLLVGDSCFLLDS